jgi:predicted nucleic acid-binding protein
MDLADAFRVTTAESLSLTRVFTVDRHFRVYRLKDSRAFDVVP